MPCLALRLGRSHVRNNSSGHPRWGTTLCSLPRRAESPGPASELTGPSSSVFQMEKLRHREARVQRRAGGGAQRGPHGCQADAKKRNCGILGPPCSWSWPFWVSVSPGRKLIFWAFLDTALINRESQDRRVVSFSNKSCDWFISSLLIICFKKHYYLEST